MKISLKLITVFTLVNITSLTSIKDLEIIKDDYLDLIAENESLVGKFPKHIIDPASICSQEKMRTFDANEYFIFNAILKAKPISYVTTEDKLVQSVSAKIVKLKSLSKVYDSLELSFEYSSYMYLRYNWIVIEEVVFKQMGGKLALKGSDDDIVKLMKADKVFK